MIFVKFSLKNFVVSRKSLNFAVFNNQVAES